jgi:predicted aspartyl protease
MMNGTIDDSLYPRLLFTLLSQAGPVKHKALVDSGFDGQVALPYFAADHLRLEVARLAEISYANDQKVEEIICRGEILWHDEVCSVEIALSDDEQPAIGTGLFKGCVMTMDFRNDTLTIEKPAS